MAGRGLHGHWWGTAQGTCSFHVVTVLGDLKVAGTLHSPAHDLGCEAEAAAWLVYVIKFLLLHLMFSLYLRSISVMTTLCPNSSGFMFLSPTL